MVRRNYPHIALLMMVCMVFAAPCLHAEEPELVIVKYGKITVKSDILDAKVFVDDTYKGGVNTVIDSIMTGDRKISCRTEAQTVSGTFTVKKDELLKLDARFAEGRLVVQVEKVVEKVEKVEKVEPVEKKPKIEAPKHEAPKPEKPKKPVVEVKKEEKKSPEEERRSLHLNLIKVYFDDIDEQEVRISHKVNPKVISRFAEKKNKTGTYYRTKKNQLLCDAGPCEQQWSTSFVYADEEGKGESFSLTWKQIVFNGITPQGTSKRELLYCLNGACQSMEDAATGENPQAVTLGRYHITWTKSSLVIRRSDIMKEIQDAGGSLDAY